LSATANKGFESSPLSPGHPFHQQPRQRPSRNTNTNISLITDSALELGAGVFAFLSCSETAEEIVHWWIVNTELWWFTFVVEDPTNSDHRTRSAAAFAILYIISFLSKLVVSPELSSEIAIRFDLTSFL